MSEESVETVERFFEAMDRASKAYWGNPRSIADSIREGALDAEAKEAWGLMHSEVVWNTAGFGTHRGHLEIAAAWDDIFEVVEDYEVSVREIRQCSDERVFAGVDRTGTGKGSGIRASFPLFAVITVGEGLIVQIDEYADRNEALEAAGLSE
jgi:limonene-1,2-epoxide hydrolase